jgi:threonine/homoserine/homoserine lactone efflux protein
MLQAFLVAWIGVCAAQASPGPNMMAVAEAALGQGRRAALFVVAGIATGSLAWALLMALGLGAVFHAFPALLTVLKFVGGAYLGYLGLRALVSVRRGKSLNPVPLAGERSSVAAWRQGLLVVLTNPKAALMWSAIATFLFGAGLGGLEVLAFGPVVALSATAIYGTYGIIFSTGVALGFYQRFARVIQALFGIIFGGLGAALIWSGLRDLRA